MGSRKPYQHLRLLGGVLCTLSIPGSSDLITYPSKRRLKRLFRSIGIKDTYVSMLTEKHIVYLSRHLRRLQSSLRRSPKKTSLRFLRSIVRYTAKGGKPDNLFSKFCELKEQNKKDNFPFWNLVGLRNVKPPSFKRLPFKKAREILSMQIAEEEPILPSCDKVKVQKKEIQHTIRMETSIADFWNSLKKPYEVKDLTIGSQRGMGGITVNTPGAPGDSFGGPGVLVSQTPHIVNVFETNRLRAAMQLPPVKEVTYPNWEAISYSYLYGDSVIEGTGEET